MFPLNDVGHLFKSEGIVFDGKRRMDGTNTVCVVKTGIPAHIGANGEYSNTPGNFSDQFDHGVGDGERRIRSCCHCSLNIGF